MEDMFELMLETEFQIAPPKAGEVRVKVVGQAPGLLCQVELPNLANI